MARGVTLNPDNYRVGYSGDLNSEQFMDTMNMTRDDLLEAYRRQKKINERLLEQQKVSSLANSVITSKIAELDAHSVTAATNYTAMTNQLTLAIAAGVMTDENYPSEVFYNAFSTDTNVALVTNTYIKAEIEKDYGQLVLPVKTGRDWTHIPQVPDEDGDYVASPYVHLYLNDQQVELNRDSPEYHMVGSNTRVWIDEDTKDKTTIIYITTPNGGRPELNYFAIKPFPADTFTINNIEYHTGSGWSTVPRLTAALGLTADNMCLYFDTVPYGRQFRITLTNGSIGSYKYMGVEQIFAGVKEFEDEAKLYLHYTDTGRITHITGIDCSWSVSPNSVANSVTYNPVDIRIVKGSAITGLADEDIRLEIVNATTASGLVFSTLTGATEFTTRDSPISLTAIEDDIWVELTLRKVGNTTPVVDYLMVYYKYDTAGL